MFDSECGIVGATFGFAGNGGFDDFADEDGMVALFDGVDEAAFEDGRGVGQDGGACGPLVVGFAADGAVFDLGFLDEGGGDVVLALGQQVECEGAALLNDVVAGGVGFDANDEEGGLETGLGDPADSGGTDFVVMFGGEDVEALGDHS